MTDPTTNSSTTVPSLLDLTITNITPNTLRINAQCPSPRLRYLLARLVCHLHDFARETRLSTPEWLAAVQFLVDCGKISSDVRQEFILLSDILGLSLLVDSINHPKPPGATEGSVLGPFHRDDAPVVENGGDISGDPKGEGMIFRGRVRDMGGHKVEGVKVDVWETDSEGRYDVQHGAETEGTTSERAVLRSDEEGKFWFRLIRPVPYPIPSDGPVGKLLVRLGRHCWRPAHLHFMFEKEGMDQLVTALYLRGDPYETSDAVFGVKSSLIVEPRRITDPDEAVRHGVPVGTWLLEHEFVLVTQTEADNLRDRNAVEALAAQGLHNMKLVNHLPVPEVD